MLPNGRDHRNTLTHGPVEKVATRIKTLRKALLWFVFCTTALSAKLNSSDYLMDGITEAFTSSQNLILLGTAAVSIFALRNYDDDMQRYSQKHGLMSNTLSHQLDLYGGRWAYPALLGRAMLKSGTRDEKMKRLLCSSSAIGVTIMTTIVIKKATGRLRPNGENRRSFPSGHTSGSFAVAAVVDELYGEKAGAPTYLIAGLVGVHRIHDNQHWLTDVIAGATLGTIVGRGFAAVYRAASNDNSSRLVPERYSRPIIVRLVIPIH